MNSLVSELPPADFYVYLIRRLDGTPCYVGKGRGGRHLQHERRTHNPHLRRIYAKEGSLPVEKVYEGLSQADAFTLEGDLITMIGRRAYCGPLVNMTDGGGGMSGHPGAWKGRPRDEPTKAKLRAALLGRKLSPEHVAKVSSGIRSSPKAAAHIAALADKSRGVPLSPEHREKLKMANTGVAFTEERRAAISAAQKGKKRGPMSPEALAMRRAKMAGRERSPEWRSKLSAAATAQHARRRAMGAA